MLLHPPLREPLFQPPSTACSCCGRSWIGASSCLVSGPPSTSAGLGTSIETFAALPDSKSMSPSGATLIVTPPLRAI